MTKKNGFSFVEMMIVVGIVILFTAIGALYFSHVRANNAVTMSVQMVASDLKLAKDTASMNTAGAEIDLGVPVTGGVALVIKTNGAQIRQDALPSQAKVGTSWGSNALVFKQNGGTASFTGTGTITITNTSGSLSKLITVDSLTGGVEK